jgi:hypothetical protein
MDSFFTGSLDENTVFGFQFSVKKVVAPTFYTGPLLSDFHVSLFPPGYGG